MKVTFCAHDRPGYVGGPNAGLRRLFPELRRRGVHIRVLFQTTDGEPAECPTIQSLRRDGFDCPAIHRPEYSEQQVRWILERVAEDPPDVFVPNLLLPAYYAGRWLHEVGIPTIGVLRADNPFHYGLLDMFVCGDATYQVSALVCVSQFLVEEVQQKTPPDFLIRHIPSGAPLPQQVAQPPGDVLRLVYVGRLAELQKRISETTRALCRAAREIPGVSVVLYGDGDARPAVEQILQTVGDGLPVQLGGQVDPDHIQERLLEAHVLVLLSDFEGLPVAVIEAMACGLVPVCLRIRSGIPELVEDNVTGLLVDDRGDGFVAAIRRLREEPGLWERLSQAARAHIATGYATPVMADRWLALFHDLTRQAAPQASLVLPRRLDLPPVHPHLARQDRRRPPWYLRPVKLAGWLKYRLVQAMRRKTIA